MNEIVEKKAPLSAISISTGATGSKIAPRDMAEVIKFGELMSRSGAAVPIHLRENPGACMRITLQAMEWEMSPFALADKCYIVSDRIAYEAQLIAAVVNTRSGIKGRLKYVYEGEGPSLQCTVTGVLDGEEYSYTSPRFDKITTKNSPLWKTDPQQQLGYYAARSWARRYTPEVILGVYDREEAQQFQGPDNAKDVTPSIMTRLKQAQAGDGVNEGFSETFVRDETAAMGDDHSEQTDDNSDGEVRDSAPVTQSSPAGEDEPASTQSSPATNPEVDKPFLIELLRSLYAAKGPDPDVVDAQSDLFADRFKAANETTQRKAKMILTQIKMLGAGEIENGECIEYLAGVIGVDPDDLFDPDEKE